jgi:hypothetical protein
MGPQASVTLRGCKRAIGRRELGGRRRRQLGLAGADLTGKIVTLMFKGLALVQGPGHRFPDCYPSLDAVGAIKVIVSVLPDRTLPKDRQAPEADSAET